MIHQTRVFLRPGNLWKTFDVSRNVTTNQMGYPVSGYQKTGEQITGIISQATTNQQERTKHLWDQDLHSLSHTLVTRGRCDLRKGDLLASTGDDEKAYLVLATDDVASLGLAGLAYLEERNDLKG
jgi:hypothetical protein